LGRCIREWIFVGSLNFACRRFLEIGIQITVTKVSENIRKPELGFVDADAVVILYNRRVIHNLSRTVRTMIF